MSKPFEFPAQGHNVTVPGYSEAKALENLLRASFDAFENLLARMEAGVDDGVYDQIIITVNGVASSFMLGAPQYEALHAFIEHLAGENLHCVDYTNNTVEGFL